MRTVKCQIYGVQRPWPLSSRHSLSALMPHRTPVRCPAVAAVLSQNTKTVQCHQQTTVLQSVLWGKMQSVSSAASHNSVSNSSRYKLKRRGLAGHPCSTPMLHSNILVAPLRVKTHDPSCAYIKVMPGLCLPFLSASGPSTGSLSGPGRFIEFKTTAIKFTIGMPRLLRQRTDDEIWSVLQNILPETSLTLASAFTMLRP